MPKLLILCDAHAYLPEIESKAPGWEIVINPPKNEIPAHIANTEIFFGYPHRLENADMLMSAKELKWIQSLSAGVETMPFDHFKKAGIFLTTTSGMHAESISENVFGMMIGFARQLFNLHIDQMNRHWNHDYSDIGGLSEIHGKTVGIIGAGAIGAEIARIAKAFNMRVLGLRRSGKPEAYYDVMYGPDGLDSLLAESDYVVNILPATKETEKTIGDRQFDLMKRTAVYIAVGRGMTTDTDAIIRAMTDDKIAGAGLDVVYPEPLPQDSPLWAMKNVYIASHNAGGSDRYIERAMEIFLPNLDSYIAKGIPAINLIDLNLHY